MYSASAVLVEWLPFLLVDCISRRLNGALRVGATLSLGRVCYHRRSFDMAQGTGDGRVKKSALLISFTHTRTEGRASVRGSKFTTNAATPQGKLARIGTYAKLKFYGVTDCVLRRVLLK
jgi:hypothetical protein